MRSTIAVLGLAAVVTAAKTVTEVVDVTITSCAPTVTGCAYNEGSWGAWPATTTPSKPIKETSTWADWDPSKPKTTTKAETWSEWDPAKPKTTTKATSSWEEWNSSYKPSSVKPATGTETWGVWESGKPSSTVTCPKYTETAAPTWLAALPSDIKSSLASKWSTTVPADWCYYSYSAIPQTVVTATGKVPVATATGTGSWAAWTPDATTKGPIATYKGAASKNAVAGLAGVAGLAALLL